MNSNDKHASRQMQELMQRNQILEAQIAEQAVQISGLNEQLQITKEKLAGTIIEYQLTEKALRESESHFRLMTENVVDVVWKLDHNYCFTYISPADEKQRGYRADEVIGHHVFEIFN